MERICEERHSNGLPSLAIQWGAIGDVGLVANMQEDNKEFVIGGTLPQKITSCLSLLDTFLLQPCPIVASMVVAEKHGGLSQSASVLQYVANVLGIKDLKAVNHYAPLAELGMDSMMAVEIKHAVEITFEIFLTAEEVRNLTLSSLVEMTNKSAVKAEIPVLEVSSALLKLDGMKSCKLVNHQCLPGSHTVYVLPGIEGDPGTMPILSSKICAACLKCFQPGFSETNEYHGISVLAQSILPHIVHDLTKLPEFTIVGFSFGGLVALELTALLESKGYKGTLVLIDSSPEFLKASIQQMGKDYALACLSDILPKMGCQPTVADQLQAQGTGLEWSKKLDVAMTLFPDPEIQNSLQVRAYLTTVYNRMTEVVMGSHQFKTIQSSVTLIKSTDESLQAVGEAYGLERICQNIAGIHTVSGTHHSIVEDAETARIINTVLENSGKD